MESDTNDMYVAYCLKTEIVSQAPRIGYLARGLAVADIYPSVPLQSAICRTSKLCSK